MNNIPKNFAPAGETAFIPSSINLKSVKLTNHLGLIYELRPIIDNFSITESIYSTSIIVNLGIIDSNNLIEDLQLIGQEKIEIVISRSQHELNNDEEIILDLLVTEFPRYKRENSENVQSFSIAAASSFSVYDKTFKISRAYNNNTSDEIKKILQSDLSVAKITELSTSISRSRGILKWQHPLQAVEYFRKNTYNDVSSPFFVFQKLNGEVVIAALSDLVTAELYGTYFDGKEYTSKPMSRDDYIERSTRMINTQSELKFGKTFNSLRGAYASENNYLDYGNKTYTKIDFTYNNFDVSNTLNNKTSLSKTSDIDYSTTYQAHCEYISTNEFSYEGDTLNHNNLRKDSGHILNAFNENLEFTTHNIELFGDSYLNAGSVIELKFPKVIDPQARATTLYNDDSSDIYDQSLSGRYIIISAVHRLEDGEYYTNVRVKKESLNINI